MAYVTSFSRIEKAKKPVKAPSALYHKIDRLFRGKSMKVYRDLSSGLNKFKGKVDEKKVYSAWVSGDVDRVMQNVPWSDLRDDIGPALEISASSLIESGKLSLSGMLFGGNLGLRWDTTNPRVRDWIASRTAKNFTELSDDSAQNIQRAVAASMNTALTPRQVANRIKGSIGLLPRHADAVERYRQNLLGTMSRDRAEKLSDAYADKLLDYRAMMIGRTETRMATNAGQLSVWRAAADQGFIDRHTTGKRWIVDGNPCEDCAPMHGVMVPIDSFFVMLDGSTVDFPPMDVHPHCECGMEIVYDVAPDDFDDGNPEEEEEQ